MKEEYDRQGIMSQIQNEINSIDEEICDLRTSLQNQIKTGPNSPIINLPGPVP